MKNNTKISLREINFSDIEFLWYLRNQPDIYKRFRNSQPISWEKHIQWILPVILGLSNKEIFLIRIRKIPIGQIRFDYQTSDISISVLKEFQEKGIASKALNLAIKKIKEEKEVKKIIAEIDKDNLPSIKLFEKLGFSFKKRKGKWLKYFLEL